MSDQRIYIADWGVIDKSDSGPTHFSLTRAEFSAFVRVAVAANELRHHVDLTDVAPLMRALDAFDFGERP